jgi:hypothetical protein
MGFPFDLVCVAQVRQRKAARRAVVGRERMGEEDHRVNAGLRFVSASTLCFNEVWQRSRHDIDPWAVDRRYCATFVLSEWVTKVNLHPFVERRFLRLDRKLCFPCHGSSHILGAAKLGPIIEFNRFHSEDIMALHTRATKTISARIEQLRLKLSTLDRSVSYLERSIRVIYL